MKMHLWSLVTGFVAGSTQRIADFLVRVFVLGFDARGGRAAHLTNNETYIIESLI